MPAIKEILRYVPFNVACLALGCLYTLDIRVDSEAIALGVNAFFWLNLGLVLVAAAAGAASRNAQHAVLVFVAMVGFTGLGILLWLRLLLLRNPSDNLWPLGLVVYGISACIALACGTAAGFAGKHLIARRIDRTAV